MHAIKAYVYREGRYRSSCSECQQCMSVSGQPHSQAALLQPPIEYETGWAPEPVWLF